jgi:hypothetical protein
MVLVERGLVYWGGGGGMGERPRNDGSKYLYDKKCSSSSALVSCLW